MSERDKLNEAILEAHSRGLRPFKCWGCRDWFTEGPLKGKRGRRRIVCDDPECRWAREYWVRFGRWPLPRDPGRTPSMARPPSALPVKLLFEISEAA